MNEDTGPLDDIHRGGRDLGERLSAQMARLDAGGLTRLDHPLLTVAISAPETGGVILAGRLAPETHPWLTDHRVSDTVLLPGTAHVDLALRAGAEIGFPVLARLVHEVPLAVPAHGAVQLQVVVGERTGAGTRPVRIWSRPEGAADAVWMRHASGELTASDLAAADDLGEWPPPEATPLAVDGGHERLRAVGSRSGSGLRAAWRYRDDLYAEVELPDAAHGDPAAFGIHPALLDAVLQVGLLGAGAEAVAFPVAWNTVVLRAAGAIRLRVRLTYPAADRIGITAADHTGQPVLTVASLATRPASGRGPDAQIGESALFAVQWSPMTTIGPVVDPEVVHIYGPDDLELIEADCAPPAIVAGVEPAAAGTTPARGQENTVAARRLVEGWLARPDLVESRLVLVTRRAVSVGEHDHADLAVAPVWELVRAAQAANPDRIVLLDTDAAPDEDIAGPLLARAMASGETELAIRGAELLAPRPVPLSGGIRDAPGHPPARTPARHRTA
ncbi:polyketide synthase dehydratase domain-containing protein [Couchioplanes caeruleus]|uniref:Polyketide synthase-like dehydratase family protein n=1 Tax=Couchioplanes caeruleus TaxID=56438 RepID=A0A3N1GM44_9ACTN|nr:polyketide synthase dehydratase domain-containing protein [Couchioplanes caeruleus]ROP31333.1 polyketide synthase-like dehydratase family protein [Couchioplanes caeruleus]